MANIAGEVRVCEFFLVRTFMVQYFIIKKSLITR